jgi:hypothetical protein
MGVRQVSLSAVASRVWEIYRDQAAVLLGTAAILFALQFLVYLLIGSTAGIFIASWPFLVLSTVYEGMVVRLVVDVEDGKRSHSVGSLLRSAVPVVGPLIGVSLLFTIGIVVGFVLLIIPGLYLITIWCVLAPVIVLERPGVFKAFGRSWDLVQGHGWAVFRVALGILFAVTLVSILVVPVAWGFGSLARSLVEWAVDTAFAPVEALAVTVLYLMLRRVHGETGLAAQAPSLSQLA